MKVIFVTFLLFGLALGVRKVQPTGNTTPAPEPEFNCECSRRNTGRIFDGVVTQKNEYTWMAALEEDEQHFCGGSIITQKHILTASHCFFDEVTSRQSIFEKDLEIVVGGHDLSNVKEPDAQRLKVKEIIIHERYNPCNQNNDIAIVVTATSITYNDNVRPICMSTEKLKDRLKDQVVKVTGWGLIARSDTDARVKALRELDLKVVDHQNCRNQGANQICAYQPGKDACKGDSGGALVWLHPTNHKFTQVGLVSYGLDKTCDKITQPGVYTDVTAYLDWINLKISPLKDEAHTCHEVHKK